MPKMTLVTLDYPPRRGGVARYLKNLVDASNGEMDVVIPDNAEVRWWQLISVCRSLRGKVVFVSHVFPVGTAAWVSRLLGGPSYAVLFHGLDLRMTRSFIKRWLLRRICASATALFVNSHATSAELRSLVPWASATVLTPGLESVEVPSRDEARRALGIDPDERIVLSVTRLVPRKGIDVTLKAMSILQHAEGATHPPQYVVVGDGADLSRLENIADEYRTNVRWVRDADDAEKWQWFAAADVFALPVRDTGDDVEGFGIVFLEAARVGIPSVAGKSGGAGEAVIHDQTGILVHPTSAHDVAEAVHRLLTHPELRQRLGSEAQARVMSDFQWLDRWALVKRVLHI